MLTEVTRTLDLDEMPEAPMPPPADGEDVAPVALTERERRAVRAMRLMERRTPVDGVGEIEEVRAYFDAGRRRVRVEVKARD